VAGAAAGETVGSSTTLAASGDNHLFTGERLVDRAGKSVFGVGNAESGHQSIHRLSGDPYIH
jgi:hypothetical protein